jgi:virulence-associated protein VapD
MRKLQRGDFIKTILNLIENKTEELFDLGLTIIFNPRKLTRGMSLYRDYNYPIYKRINNLKNSRYFTFSDGNFYLSNAGRVEIIKNIIKKKKEMKNWDGIWRAIIFDVPEKKRYKRNFLRRELKLMGFKELQHSVWITPYDVEKELLCLLKLWHEDFKGDIRFLSIHKINQDSDFRKTFCLEK